MCLCVCVSVYLCVCVSQKMWSLNPHVYGVVSTCSIHWLSLRHLPCYPICAPLPKWPLLPSPPLFLFPQFATAGCVSCTLHTFNIWPVGIAKIYDTVNHDDFSSRVHVSLWYQGNPFKNKEVVQTEGCQCVGKWLHSLFSYGFWRQCLRQVPRNNC